MVSFNDEDRSEYEVAPISAQLLIAPSRSSGTFVRRRCAKYAYIERGDWFKHRRLLVPIGNEPLAELE